MSPEEIQGIFFAECDESLQAAETGLAACREEPIRRLTDLLFRRTAIAMEGFLSTAAVEEVAGVAAAAERDAAGESILADAHDRARVAC